MYNDFVIVGPPEDPADMRGLALREISGKVAEALDRAGIGHLQLRNARARIFSPRILLLDEPTANMDIESRSQTCDMIKRLKNDGVSIIIATHKFQTIAHLCDDHLSLESGMLRHQPLEQAGGERKIIPHG